jgi:hypothetical protein
MGVPIRPAAIVFVPAGAIGASLIKQALTDLFPNGICPIEPSRVGSLNFDDARAARAFHSQDMLPDFTKGKMLDGGRRLSGPTLIGQQARP